MAHLTVNVLGEPQVLLDDVPIQSFESDKVRALLAYLVVESDRPHSREALIGVQAFLRRHPIELMGGYIESFEWLKLEGFRPFTLVIDRQGILRKHFFGVSDYEGFESHIRPYL